MGIIVFGKHAWRRISKPLSSNSQDMGVAIALYVVYPAILWLLIDKFHGICGFETYEIKQEAIAANNAVFLWFTALMRTHKIASILVYQADAGDKREDDAGQDGEEEYEGCTRQKCRIWFTLSQELTAIAWVAFLLLICLPVLAFWSMFIGIFVSSYNIYSLLRRLWRDAHSGAGRVRTEEQGTDIEFQEFLSNFTDDTGEQNGN